MRTDGDVALLLGVSPSDGVMARGKNETGLSVFERKGGQGGRGRWWWKETHHKSSPPRSRSLASLSETAVGGSASGARSGPAVER